MLVSFQIWYTWNNSCLDEAAEVALLPSFNGYIGDIQISGTMIMDLYLRYWEVLILNVPSTSTLDPSLCDIWEWNIIVVLTFRHTDNLCDFDVLNVVQHVVDWWQWMIE